MTKTPKRPRDPNQLAKLVIDLATGDVPIANREAEPEMTLLGRIGGLRGGRARAEKLSPARRKEIAQRAAAGRWAKTNGEKE